MEQARPRLGCGRLGKSLRYNSEVLTSSVVSRVAAFAADDDGAARKSQELILELLEYSERPFSRDQFSPGHITATGLVLHPERDSVLLVHHRRLDRWLLPGGHVEETDTEIWETAWREVLEETGARPEPSGEPLLVGLDVHGIPPKRREPFHLHHDLVFACRAADEALAISDEARAAVWCSPREFDNYQVPESIRISFSRAAPYYNQQSSSPGRLL